MYKELKEINNKPKVFEFYTAEELWADEYTSKQMLSYHLNTEIDVSSRNKKFIDKSTSWIISEFNIHEKSNVCDFGCAVGFYTTAFARTGANVTGIDFSKSSLEYASNIAKQEKLEIDYIHQNYLDYVSDKKYDLITMIMCDFCALSHSQRKILLDKFHSLLEDGGSVLLDVYSLNNFETKVESATYEHNQLNSFWSPNDYYAFVNTFKYDAEKVVLDKYTIIEEKSSKVVYNWLQYFSIEMLTKEFEASGLTIKKVYNDVSGAQYKEGNMEFAIVAMKE